mgnify:CR=1 FL=1
MYEHTAQTMLCRVIMKHFFILFLLYLLSTTLFASGKFYVVSNQSSILENVKNDKVIVTQLVTKQTYDCNTNIYSINNNTNDCIISFTGDIIVKLNEKSKLNLDTFEQKIENINDLPSIAKVSTSNFTVSLFGSAQFFVNNTFTEDKPFIVATPLANILIKSGKIIIKSDEKSVLLIVLEGETTVFDTLSKRTQKVNDKNMLVIVPAPKLQGKAAEHMRKQNMFSLKTLDDTEFNELNLDLITLKETQSNIKFIVVNQDIVGVKIR